MDERLVMQLITPADAAGRVTAALKSAAEATGAGFDYLLSTAQRESSLTPTAQAPNSSARGLFQFIDQTWLEVLKEEGPKLGLGDAAADVSKTGSGKYVVQDPGRRAELLAMRDDPEASAMLAGAFTRRNAAQMTSALGRAPTQGELYVAHFLGAQGATQLVSLAATSPQASAADAFPAQAASNRAIFYDKSRERTALEVYGKLTSTPASAVAKAPAAPVMLASSTGSGEPGRFNGGVENGQAAFHSLFKTGRRSPVSAYVAQAWSAFGDAGLASDVVGAAARKVAAGGLASDAVVRAYAEQPAASVTRSAASAAAVDAVSRAAASKPRRVPVPAPAPKVAAAPAAAPQSVAIAPKAETGAAIPVAPAPKPFDLSAFLRSVLTAPSRHETRRGRP